MSEFNLETYYQKNRQAVTRQVNFYEACIEVRYLPRDERQEHTERLEKITGTAEARKQKTIGLMQEFYAGLVVGWEGMTPQVLAKALDCDVRNIPDEALPEGELPFSLESAKTLVAQCPAFQALVTSTCNDLAAMRDEEQKQQEKN